MGCTSQHNCGAAKTDRYPKGLTPANTVPYFSCLCQQTESSYVVDIESTDFYIRNTYTYLK
jgi:hypothetical protein